MEDLRTANQIARDLKKIHKILTEAKADLDRLRDETERKSEAMSQKWDKFSEEQEDEYSAINDIQDDVEEGISYLDSAIAEIGYAIQDGGCKIQ